MVCGSCPALLYRRGVVAGCSHSGAYGSRYRRRSPVIVTGISESSLSCFLECAGPELDKLTVELCLFADSARRGIFHASIQRSRGVDSAGTSTSASWMRAEYQCKAPLIPASPCLLLIRTRSQSLSMCPTRIGVNARDLRLCAKHDTRTIRSMPVDQA